MATVSSANKNNTMIQFRLDHHYISELDRLLARERENLPDRPTTGNVQQQTTLRKRPADTIAFTLDKRHPETAHQNQ